MELFPVTRRIENLIIERALWLLEQPEEDVGVGRGLARATHVLAFIERTHDLYFSSDVHNNRPGLFPRAILDKVAHRLRHANLQPEESRFRDILDWKNADKAQLRDELRSNLLRLLRENPDPFGKDALELHVLWDLRMQYNATPYASIIEPGEYEMYPSLVDIRDRCIAMFPELRKVA